MKSNFSSSSTKRSNETLTLRPGNSEDFTQIFEQFTHEFWHENKTLEEMLELLNRKSYRFWHIHDTQKSHNVGYAIIFHGEKNPFMWLDYLVIFEKYRNLGIGRNVLSQLLPNLKPQKSGIFLEVDIRFKTAVEHQNLQRRIRFYEGLGALKVTLPECMHTDEPFHAMNLYYLPFDSTSIFSSIFLHACLQEIFHYFQPHSELHTLQTFLSRIEPF